MWIHHENQISRKPTYQPNTRTKTEKNLTKFKITFVLFATWMYFFMNAIDTKLSLKKKKKVNKQNKG